MKTLSGFPCADAVLGEKQQTTASKIRNSFLNRGVVTDRSIGLLAQVTRLMELAIRLDPLILAGEVTDYSELARLGHVTRARMSQIMNLLMLAPDIQEEILFLPRVTGGRDPTHLRHL